VSAVHSLFRTCTCTDERRLIIMRHGMRPGLRSRLKSIVRRTLTKISWMTPTHFGCFRVDSVSIYLISMARKVPLGKNYLSGSDSTRYLRTIHHTIVLYTMPVEVSYRMYTAALGVYAELPSRKGYRNREVCLQWFVDVFRGRRHDTTSLLLIEYLRS
jgi:hypothetical protein